MAGKKSLSDLGELTNPKPEAPEVAEAPAEAAAPAQAEQAPAEAAEAPAGDDQGVSTQGPQIQAILRE
jgi:small subunit ribosomal protein S9